LSEGRFVPGDAAGGFTVIAPCGAGAFGQVYLVRDAAGRIAALKVLSPDRRGGRELDGLLRFRRAEHPNLLHVGDLFTLPDGRVCYTMDAADNAAENVADYVPDTLARRLRERGAIPADELKRIMLELVSGLAALHRAHLLHRDIKPENILFVDGRATLADAGAVGEFDGTTLVGTPEYLPPEVCLQTRAFRATDDCYALGKVLYSALTGEPPRRFPSTPRSLDGEAVALFRVAERACTPPGVSAYTFRELLEHPERSAPRRNRRRIAFAAAVILSGMAVAAAVYPKTPKRVSPDPVRVEHPAAVKPAQTPSVPVSVPTPEPGPETPRRLRAESEAFVQKMKADEARLRAEQERIKSPTVRPVGQGRRDANDPTLAELMNKYRRTPEEERLVDRWLAEYVSFDRRIAAANSAGDKMLAAELAAERSAKFPWGIDDFCDDEIRTRKYLDTLTRSCTPAKREQLETVLRYRRDSLRKLLEKLPSSELAKWR